MRKIWIPNSKAYAIVDNEDYEKLSGIKWHINNNGYVVSTRYVRGSGRANCQYTLSIMSRLVMNAPKGKVVDHINGNKKDNRKSNLRLCTQKENSRNRKANKGSRSGYKGVVSSGVLWYAKLRKNGKTYDLGLYTTPEQAAQAYNQAAIKHFGKFALLNKIKRLRKIDIADVLRDKGLSIVLLNQTNGRKMYWGKRFWYVSEGNRVIRKTEQKRVAIEYLTGQESR